METVFFFFGRALKLLSAEKRNKESIAPRLSHIYFILYLPIFLPNVLIYLYAYFSKFVEERLGLKRNWTLVTPQHDRQVDGISCGVYALCVRVNSFYNPFTKKKFKLFSSSVEQFKFSVGEYRCENV